MGELTEDLIHATELAYQYDKKNSGFNYEIQKPETYNVRIIISLIVN